MTGLEINRSGMAHKSVDVSQRRNPRILFASLAAAGALTLGGCSIHRNRETQFDLSSGTTHFEKTYARSPTYGDSTSHKMTFDVNSIAVSGPNCTINLTIGASLSDPTTRIIHCDHDMHVAMVSTALTLRPTVVPAQNGSHVVLHVRYQGYE